MRFPLRQDIIMIVPLFLLEIGLNMSLALVVPCVTLLSLVVVLILVLLLIPVPLIKLILVLVVVILVVDFIDLLNSPISRMCSSIIDFTFYVFFEFAV